MQELEKAKSDSQNNILIWNEQHRSAEININRLSAEKGFNKEKKNSLNDKILTYHKDVGALEPDIKTQKQFFDKKNKEFNKIEETYLSAQEQIKTLEKSRWNSQERLVGERSNLDRAISSSDEKTTVI